jgi:hypothetical protein
MSCIATCNHDADSFVDGLTSVFITVASSDKLTEAACTAVSICKIRLTTAIYKEEGNGDIKMALITLKLYKSAFIVAGRGAEPTLTRPYKD